MPIHRRDSQETFFGQRLIRSLSVYKLRLRSDLMSKSHQTGDDSRLLLADAQGPRDEQQDAGICLSASGHGTAGPTNVGRAPRDLT